MLESVHHQKPQYYSSAFSLDPLKFQSLHAMKYHLDSAEIFIPGNEKPEEALQKTTHLAIAAHQDDLEIMAAAPILNCLLERGQSFSGVVVTDGRSSPREGIYKGLNDEEMRQVRHKEQKKAAVVGEYVSLILLDYASKDVIGSGLAQVVEDLVVVLKNTQPEVVYTHNPADKHDTHVAVSMGVIQSIRRLPEHERPKRLLGCEVWRDLDWLLDEDKVIFDLSFHENLQAALLGVFDSQIAGGKRYDQAALGRRRAHATFFQSHEVDENHGLSYGMDLTPLIEQVDLSISEFVEDYIKRFSLDVRRRIKRFET